MITIFELQRPNLLTDVVAGDETFISFDGVPSKQANNYGVDQWTSRTQTWMSELEAALHYKLIPQLCWIAGGRLSAQECDDAQPPLLHGNNTGKSCCDFPRTAVKRGKHKNIISP